MPNKKAYDKYREAGLCVQGCGRSAIIYTRCAQCALKGNYIDRKLYERTTSTKRIVASLLPHEYCFLDKFLNLFM